MQEHLIYKHIKIPEVRALQVQLEYKISKEEAITRLQLLQISGIFESFSPQDPEFTKVIDNFLSQDSQKLKDDILMEQVLLKCMNNKSFVAGYDRLTGSKIAREVESMRKGNMPSDQKAMDRFKKFVEDTVLFKYKQSFEQQQQTEKN